MRRSSTQGTLRPLNVSATGNKKRTTGITPTAIASAVQQGKVQLPSGPHVSVASSLADAKQRVKRRAERVLNKAVATAQSQTHPNHAYFTVVQRGKFTPELRKNVVMWMQRCAGHFGLLPETLEMAIYMFDRFLSLVHIPGDKHVRVVGVTCVFLASKLNESMEDGPAIRDLVIASGGAFSVNDIMRMERIVLQKLTWNVGNIVTNAMVGELVLDALTKVDEDPLSSQQHQHMLQQVHSYLRDIQTNAHFMRFNPSVMAAAACIIATTRTIHGVDMKRVYSVMCGLTNTEDATVAECVDVLDSVTAEVAPLF